MSRNEPLVSIFMPTYNQEDYIEEAVISALSQDYENIEVVVCDDGSFDSTPEKLKSLQRKYGKRKLKVHLHDDNVGVTKNCNRCLRYCKGDFIAFFAGDDILYPNKVSRQIAEILKEGAVFSYHKVEAFDSESKAILSVSGKRESKALIPCRELFLEYFTMTGADVSGISIMLKRELIYKDFNEEIPICSDFTFFCDYLAANKEFMAVYIPEVLARYRRHKTNLSKKYEHFLDHLSTIDLIGNEYGWIPERVIRRAKANFYFNMAMQARIVSKRSFYNYFFCSLRMDSVYVLKKITTVRLRNPRR